MLWKGADAEVPKFPANFGAGGKLNKFVTVINFDGVLLKSGIGEILYS